MFEFGMVQGAQRCPWNKLPSGNDLLIDHSSKHLPDHFLKMWNQNVTIQWGYNDFVGT
jgi:hypothetical protein